jgi:hypothetical protein
MWRKPHLLIGRLLQPLLLLQVDPGGCLSSRTAGGGCMLCSAAVRVGVVDALVNQMLSAVERVKREVEHPPTVQQPAQVNSTRPVTGVKSAGMQAWLMAN